MKHKQGLSIRAYAAHRRERGLPGGTLRAVQKALESGRITRTEAGKISPAAADRDWHANTYPDRRDLAPPAPRKTSSARSSGKPAPPPQRKPAHQVETPQNESLDSTSYADARAIVESIKAKMANLDYQERAGALVKKEDVERAAFAQARQVRDRLEALPDRLDAIFAAETDPSIIRFTLRDEINLALKELANDSSG